MYVCVYVSICATEKFIKGAENYVVERLFNDQKKKRSNYYYETEQELQAKLLQN